MRFRITTVNIFTSNPKDDGMLVYERPALQVKILFFWITLKRFLYEDKLKAFKVAKKVCNTLNKESEL